jgi:hypothetical protein
MGHGSYGDKGGNILQSAMSSRASLWELSEDALGSNIKMSSQKAMAILHWFSARYGDNSPVSVCCNYARADVLNGNNLL